MTKLLFTIFLLIPSFAFSMDSKLFDKMMANIHSNQFLPVEKFLEKNQLLLEKDPEYYVILLNYSFKKGHKKQIVIAKGKAEKGDFELRDKDTGKPVGFIGEKFTNSSDLIINGITRTQKALSNFNNRLDIHFGIIHIASKIQRWDILCEQAVKILSLSKENGNNWIWGTINSMTGNPKEFMLENIQAEASALFHIGTEESDESFIKISETMIREYPEIVYGYSNLGTLYLANKQYTSAEKYLKKAISIAPEDEIVKSNLVKLKSITRR